MKTKICIILLTFASNANAGRHAISREVAQQVVETRFAQHYRDEGRLKEIENEAMASAIASATTEPGLYFFFASSLGTSIGIGRIKAAAERMRDDGRPGP